MSRRALWIWLAIYFACACFVVAHRSAHGGLLTDSDTVGIFKGIRENPHPWSWFVRDWPLGNHFYRPVSTLTFVVDGANASAARVGLTNAVLAALSVLGLGGLTLALRRWLNLDWVLAAPIVFTAWCLDQGFPVFVAASVAAVGLALWQRRWFTLGMVLAAVPTFYMEVGEAIKLYYRMLAWVPGRTASTMTVFVLPAMFGAVLYWRRGHWGWLALSGVCTWLALASYEQAVMVLPVMFTIWLARRESKPKPWAWILVLGAVTVAYFLIRMQVVSLSPSGYQRQQWRTGGGGFLEIYHFAVPAFAAITYVWALISTSLFALLLPDFYISLVVAASPIALVCLLWRNPNARTLVWMFVAGIVAYAPMAFFHYFEHYFFWPMAIRAVTICALAQVVWEHGHQLRPLPARPERGGESLVL
ncbi:MAG: hypothetical protein JNJ45_01395 [Chthonomonas sp.]|nr:hypothetical protein [Chthonomonas sp.]